MRTHQDLIRRAGIVTRDSMRICARSAMLIERCRAAMQTAAAAHERALAVRGEKPQIKDLPMPQRTARGWVEGVGPLPLTPPRLLELAAEFRMMADQADSPDSWAAFHALAFRYTALAAGYDTEQTSSRMLH